MGLGSILLVGRPRFTATRNDTTATAESQDGHTVAVSFWVAQPPALSLFSVHCTNDQAKRCSFSSLPCVVGADGPFVLLRAAFSSSGSTREFFLYTAADDAPPSLESIPSPFPDDDHRVREFGILDGRAGHYLLAALRDDDYQLPVFFSKTRPWSTRSTTTTALRDAPSSDDDYQIRIYSSETRSWRTRTLRNPCHGVDRVVPDKVITLPGQDQGLLAWVDLSHGLLVCNIPLLLQHQDDQDLPPGAVSFIPLPEPLPGNRYKLKYPIPPTKKVKPNPRADKGRLSASWFRDLTCLDGGVLKFIEMENRPPTPPPDDNIVYDSDLIVSLKRKAVDGNPKLQLSAFRDAWRAVTWTRKLASQSSSSSNFWRQTCAAHVADMKGQQLALTEHYSAFPVLSPDNDILYLKSLPEPTVREGSMVALDIGNKSLEATARYYLPEDFYHHPAYDPEHPFRACTLSRHLDMTNPGIQVSECRKITEDGSSARDTSTPCKPRATIQSLSELAAKLKRARNPPEDIIPKKPCISQIHPAENNLPQQHKWDAPPGHSLWPHQNNLPPQQCFNMTDGSGYAALGPRHNYQPPWPPSKYQLTSSTVFGPHEVPQPCFNNYHGARL
ncbi:unnamed protein product [Alopecurus aequalis]